MKPTAWFGTLASFGHWWAARDQVLVDVTSVNRLKTLTLHAPDMITGLTLEVPAGWQLGPNQGAGTMASQSGRQILLPGFKGQLQLQFVW